MRRHRSGEEVDDLIAQLAARQSNIFWPDYLVNMRIVYEFLWKGAENPPLVQRIGAWLIGLSYVVTGLSFLSFARRTAFAERLVLVSYAAVLVGVGAKIFLNGFRKQTSPPGRPAKSIEP